MNGEPAGTRTQDPRLKRALLYQLSYGLSAGTIGRENHFCFPASRSFKINTEAFLLHF